MIPHWVPHWIPDDLTRWQICLQGCGLSVCWSSSVFCTAKKMLWNATAKTVDFLNPRFTPSIHPSIPSPRTPPLCLASDTGSFDAEMGPIATDPAVAVTAGWFALKLDLGASAAPKISSHFAHFGPCQVVWESLWISCNFKRPSFLLCSPAHSRKKSWKDQKELYKISQKPISCLWW